MKTSRLVWYGVSKDELPSILLGLNAPRGLHAMSPQDALRHGIAPFAVGYPDAPRLHGYSVPSVVVIADEYVVELLAWLRVYSADVFPLSQFARVATLHDWNLLEESHQSDFRSDKWASVVLGEVLAQGEAGADISALPLSRASSSFTYTIARTIQCHGAGELLRVCSSRLRELESERRFVRRQVNIEALTKVWGLASADIGVGHSAADVVDLLTHALSDEAPGPPAGMLFSSSAASAGLYSDSVETRVVAFHKFGSDLQARMPVFAAPSTTVAYAIAAAAFLVGRGTSHAFLLRKSVAGSSLAFVWFGLMAALAGTRCWDADWMKAAKGIERQLRTTFSLGEPGLADISWSEYAWMAANVSGTQAFSELGRSFAKTMTIEVVPGASCQLRLNVEPAKGTEPAAQQQLLAQGPSTRELELQAIVDQFVSLANRARSISAPSGESLQRSLLGDRPTTPKSRKSVKPKY